MCRYVVYFRAYIVFVYRYIYSCACSFCAVATFAVARFVPLQPLRPFFIFAAFRSLFAVPFALSYVPCVPFVRSTFAAVPFALLPFLAFQTLATFI